MFCFRTGSIVDYLRVGGVFLFFSDFSFVFKEIHCYLFIFGGGGAVSRYLRADRVTRRWWCFLLGDGVKQGDGGVCVHVFVFVCGLLTNEEFFHFRGVKYMAEELRITVGLCCFLSVGVCLCMLYVCSWRTKE